MTTSTGAQSHNWPGPDTVVHQRLSNGLDVYVYENHTVPVVVVNGALHAGSVDEPREKAGLASLTASMLRRGTTTRSFASLNETVEAIGAAVETGGGRHATDFYAYSLSEDFDLITDLVADMLRHPAFPEEEFERLKAQTLTRIRERENDTRSVSALTFRRLLYGDAHPYGRPVSGTKETVTQVTLDDVRQFYAQRVGVQRGQVVIVGDVTPETAIQRLEEVLGDWRGAEASQSPLPPVSRPDEPRTERVTMPEKTQADIVMGWLAIPRRHPDWTAVVVANTILGRFGMGGRLGMTVREKQGMAYYAYGSIEASFGPGTWTAVAGVAPENVERAVESMLAEIRRLRDEPVPDAELEDSQAFLIGSMPIRLETNYGIASMLSEITWFDLGLDYLITLEERVRGVSPADIQRVAQTYLDPGAYVLAIAGPVQAEDGQRGDGVEPGG